MCFLRRVLHTLQFVTLVVGVRVGDEIIDGDHASVDEDVDLVHLSSLEHEAHDDDYHTAHPEDEHGHDHDDVKMLPFACHSGLNNWEKEWSEEKKDYCCKTETLGCKADHFDCLEGIDKWQTEWSLLKVDWCCHNKNIACTKCDDYSCPDTHRKISPAVAGSIKCRRSPCKNSECCELWGNMELLAKPTASPLTEHPTAVPTPMPTIKHDNDPFDCGSAIVDANKGWSREKKEWCCIHKNIGCKEDVIGDEDRGSVKGGVGADGRRRALYSDGRRRWSSSHDPKDDQECHDYYYYYHLFPNDDLLQLSLVDASETDYLGDPEEEPASDADMDSL